MRLISIVFFVLFIASCTKQKVPSGEWSFSYPQRFLGDSVPYFIPVRVKVEGDSVLMSSYNRVAYKGEFNYEKQVIEFTDTSLDFCLLADTLLVVNGIALLSEMSSRFYEELKIEINLPVTDTFIQVWADHSRTPPFAPPLIFGKHPETDSFTFVFNDSYSGIEGMNGFFSTSGVQYKEVDVFIDRNAQMNDVRRIFNKFRSMGIHKLHLATSQSTIHQYKGMRYYARPFFDIDYTILEEYWDLPRYYHRAEGVKWYSKAFEDIFVIKLNQDGLWYEGKPIHYLYDFVLKQLQEDDLVKVIMLYEGNVSYEDWLNQMINLYQVIAELNSDELSNYRYWLIDLPLVEFKSILNTIGA